MKTFFLTLGVLFAFLVTVTFAEDSPLVEAAKKEKERRAKLKAKKVFTNKDVEDFKRKNNIEDEPEAEPGTEQKASTEQSAAGEQKEEKSLADDEAYWRGRYAGATQRITAAQEKVNQLQTDINALTRQFYAEGDGVAQRGVIESERNSRLSELEQAKAELQQAQQAMQNLEEEARRAGALPGWLRD